MFSWVDPQMVQNIDVVTRRLCMRTSSQGELKQLSTLFGRHYLRHLHRILDPSQTSPAAAGSVLTIKLAWIDKIPVAKFAMSGGGACQRL